MAFLMYVENTEKSSISTPETQGVQISFRVSRLISSPVQSKVGHPRQNEKI